MSTTTSAQPAQLTRNERLDRLPFNKAHRKLLVASGIGWAFDAMDVGLVSFVVAAIAADPHFNLTPTEKSWVLSIGFVGMAIGAAVGGFIADRVGRKTVFTATLIIFGIANGAMMFDVQNIRPLFRLETGKPGSSFAVEIARKIGLPEDIIRAAGEKAGSDHINIEKQLREIARDKHYWEQKRDRIRQTDRKVEELEQTYAGQLSKIRAERQEILKKAKLEAQQLIADANRQIENTIRTIREAQAEKELTRLARRELDDFRDAVAKADTADKDAEVAREIERIERRRQRREERKAQRGEAQAAGAAPAEAPKPREVEAGSKVRMAGQDMVGVVQSVKGRKAQVAFGQILTTVDRKMLTVVSNSEFREATRPQTARTVVSADISARKLSFKDHIDVRGMRAAEALDAVQDFIDDALMVGVGSVSILHGKGTGALKEEIRRYLRTVPEVESARDEHADRGGAGITIVTFDLS